MEIKAVFFDIDGTLIGLYDRMVPQSTVKALTEMRKKGIKLFVSSGRPATFLPQLKKEIGFDFDGYVFMNGQYCTDAEGNCFHRLSFTKEARKGLYEWYKKHSDVKCTIMEESYLYSNVMDENPVNFGMSDDPVRMLTHDTFQFCPYIGPEDEGELLENIPDIKSVRWIHIFTDLIPADGGKDVGIQKVLDHFGIEREATMAFGDGANDISMLKYVQTGVAMGNASDHVKEAADYITDDVDKDGIYKALVHFDVL